MVPAQVVTHKPRSLPADMLLLRARSQRTLVQPQATEEILASDDDEFVENVPQPRSLDAGGTIFSRPITEVHLGHITWNGQIDHDALQAALACENENVGSQGNVAARVYSRDRENVPARVYSRGEPVALEITLSGSDHKLSEALLHDGRGAAQSAFNRALRLPDRIVGASASTKYALDAVLSAYRRAALAYAWQLYLGEPLEYFARERDEAAVALLSTLRAVLGER
jgi:hypothetical protein